MTTPITPDSPATSASGERVFQMLWDCRFCGTTKLLGVDHRHCPNCGAKQDAEWRYFPSDEDKKAVSDPNYKYAGADKVCPYCQTPNSASTNFCKECGGDLSTAAEAALKESVRAGSAKDIGKVEDFALSRFQAQQSAATPKSRGIPTALIIIAVLVIGAIIGLIALSRSTYGASLTVADLQWERIISVEKFTAVPGSGWDETVPPGALQLSCSTRDRAYTETERVLAGYRKVDRGDGTFREEPVYENRSKTVYRPDRWCTYVVNTWLPAGDLRTSGGADDPLVWANFQPSNGIFIGAERERGRTQNFKVFFTGNGDKEGATFTLDMGDETRWRTFSINQRYEIAFNRLEQPQWDTLTLEEPR